MFTRPFVGQRTLPRTWRHLISADAVHRRRQLYMTSWTSTPECIENAKKLRPDVKILEEDASARIVVIQGPQDLKDLQSKLERQEIASGTIVVRCQDWRVIPLENLVAAKPPSVSLAAETSSAEDAEVLLGALEFGVDGLLAGDVVSAEELQRIVAVLERVESEAPPPRPSTSTPSISAAEATDSGHVALSESEVTRVVVLPGLSDRVCVDTTSMLEPGEGLCVGSFCRAQFLVQAEVDEALYIASRPFRVNAGAVHSYVLSTRGKTAYLSELRTGSEALVVSAASGRTRTVSVGRCKIERRPMVLVEARDPVDGDEHSVILQNAETVKLLTRDGAVAITDLKPGTRVLVARHESTGRHTGIAVDESILEL